MATDFPAEIKLLDSEEKSAKYSFMIRSRNLYSQWNIL